MGRKSGDDVFLGLIRTTERIVLVNQQKIATYGQLAAFFVPLALQSITQGTTHMIVAAVASRGDGGVMNFAGLSQAFKISFFLSNLGGGLLTAGMVFGRTRESQKLFCRINSAFVILYAVLHSLLCIPAMSQLLFGRVMGLPPEIYEAARVSFIYLLPVQLLFIIRTPALAVLFLGKATARSYLATIVRIVLTLLLAFACVRYDFLGLFWAVLCMLIPLAAEAASLHFLARPYLRRLAVHSGALPTIKEIVAFGFTLSIGRILIALADWTLTIIIARAPDPARNLAAFAVASSLVQPIIFGASRIQELFVAFSDSQARTIRRFVLMVGAGCGALILCMLLPPAQRWYFIDIQRLPPGDLDLIQEILILFFVAPLVVGIRSYAQGRAAASRKANAILGGQTASFALMIGIGFGSLLMGMPGHLIGPVGIIGASIADFVIVMSLLRLNTKGLPA